MHLWANKLLLLAGAALAGYVFQIIGVPLSWMIGPMLLTATLAMMNVPLDVHRFSRPTGQVLVATAVGLYFSPAALSALIDQAGLMLASAVLTIIAGIVSALVLVRIARTDGTTAFFASLPGGPVEMALLAERGGVDGVPVVMAQTMRIMFIVLFIPPILFLLSGQSPNSFALAITTVDWPGLALLYALAWLGAMALNALGVPNSYFLGPLAVAAGLTTSGVTLSSVPFPLLAFGQVLLGCALGIRFKRENVMKDIRFVAAAMATTGILLALCFAVALGLWSINGATLASYTLATAPGSVTEMALTAKLLHQGVAIVTGFHLVRIFLLIPAAPLLFRVFRALANHWITFPTLTKVSEGLPPRD